MARSARGRRSGKSADWVYRGTRWLLADASTPEPNNSGTYGTGIAQSSAQANATAQVLYDSDRLFHNIGSIDAASAGWLTTDAAARPQGSDKGALIHGVEVDIRITPSSWALGNRLEWGFRVIVADQDPDFGVAQVDVDYGMWTNIGGLATTSPGNFANGRQNCAEFRVFSAFGDNGDGSIHVRRYLRFKRRLQFQEGLFLYSEGSPFSVNAGLIYMFCRTLVTDAS